MAARRVSRPGCRLVIPATALALDRARDTADQLALGEDEEGEGGDHRQRGEREDAPGVLRVGRLVAGDSAILMTSASS
jgi:hypothetical protein